VITAVDTVALIAIDRGEPDAEAWLERLADARGEGGLVICDVVAAEFYSAVMNDRDFLATLADLGIEFSPASREASCVAGRIFRSYRDAGGPRNHLIPDFLVAAHAMVDCDRLATADRGYLRRYFPALPIVTPEQSR
jgi:predicted nucleic acid-binding protein